MPTIILNQNDLRRSCKVETIMIGQSGLRTPLTVSIDYMPPTVMLSFEARNGEATISGIPAGLDKPKRTRTKTGAVNVPIEISRWTQSLKPMEISQIATSLGIHQSNLYTARKEGVRMMGTTIEKLVEYYTEGKK